MEERVPPAADGKHSDNHDHNKHHTTATPLPQESQSQPAFRSGTYVVQVPKDQIYRVPPPENALIADRHRNPVGTNKRPCCSRFLCCFFISVAIVFLVIGIVAVIISSILIKPRDPKFSIEHFLAKTQKSPNKNSYPEFDIRLNVQNPNGKAGILYRQGGFASLSFTQQEIATGKYPTFFQDMKNSTVFGLVLNGSNIALPKEIEKSMKSEKPKLQVSLSLTMNVPVKMKTSMLNAGSTKIDVACDLMVDSLAKASRILSQKCNTKGQS